MSVDFEPDEMEAAIRESLGALCRQHCPESLARSEDEAFPAQLWNALASFGLFSLAEPESESGIVLLAAAGDVLGRALCPGPVAQTLFAAHVLPPDLRGGVVNGTQIVSMGEPPLMPWVHAATVFLAADGDRVRILTEPDIKNAKKVRMPVAEDWAILTFGAERAIPNSPKAVLIHDVFIAAYLAAAARQLLATTSEYVATRRQFRKTLSQFQAISHPLAECAIRLRAASTLARLAAHEADVSESRAAMSAASARASAEAAALQSAYVCHQAFGAMGMTSDGPVYYVSRRLRHMASQQWGISERLRNIERSYLDDPLPPLKMLLQ